MVWNELGILFLAAAALCAVGFYKFVYFMSIGYGFAIAGLSVVILIFFRGQAGPLLAVQCLLFLAYGARLSGFLLYREFRAAGYRRTMNEADALSASMTVPVKIAVWLSVSVLYVAQVSPVFFRWYNGVSGGALPWIGAAVSAAAICLEALADRQKSAQKAASPNMTATQGLYKIVRCPNYFAEILFWTGVTLGGLSALRGWGQWLAAAAAYTAIVLIMISGAKRLEKRQESRYGSMPEYRAYADKTPILFPLIPLYHLNGEKK